MKTIFKSFLLAALALCVTANVHAQNATIRASLVDASTDEALGFVTVSLTQKNADKVYKYALSTDQGAVEFTEVKKGTFTFKAELLGYKDCIVEVNVKESVDLGTLKMEEDKEVLEAAAVTAVGNPIIIKKDTVEYNASSFKTTENDVLADLLKKLPGVEISADGAITVNGEAIKKITVDGKTFFLDDPSVASGNLPAKLINKVKVVRKKSEQAEFTGIDDGQEEMVIDLSVKKEMMKGFLGNVSLGAGHDVPAEGKGGDTRFQGAAFAGRFSDKTQISIILNGNNTNNRGFSDVSNSAMGGNTRKAGGSTGDGITTSYMGGVNLVSDLLDGAMTLGGNYMYNHTGTVTSKSDYRMTYLKDKDGNDYNRISDSESNSDDSGDNHRFGIHLEHKFSNSTSIIFEPQLNWRTNNFFEQSRENLSENHFSNGGQKAISEASTNNDGRSESVSTRGFALLRQRLGIPGRTLTLLGKYSFGNYDLNGINRSASRYFQEDRDASVNQMYNYLAKTGSVNLAATYTEPLGNKFYFQGKYAYTWDANSSGKETFDYDNAARRYSDIYNEEYSNHGKSVTNTHNIGVNLLYQDGKANLQAGFSAIPARIINSTDKYEYDSGVIWNWSPQASIRWTFDDQTDMRFSYVGSTAQPDVDKLHSVADNTDPLNISFGNPFLDPYFSHNVNGNFRLSQKKKFFTLNARVNASLVQNPIVNAIWYGTDGIQYTMPFNGPATVRTGFNINTNSVLGDTGLSWNAALGLNWSKSGYYVGNGVDMSTYVTEGYYSFMEEFHRNGSMKITDDKRFVTNKTNTVSPTGRLGIKYTFGNAEIRLNGGTSANRSWYKLGDDINANTMTFSNFLSGDALWNIESAGLVFKADCNYRWYNGYSGSFYKPETLLNAEIQKLLFKKKGTLALKGYDILGQSKTLTVSDNANYHLESCTNTLGRYIILSFTYRFGSTAGKSMQGQGMGGQRGQGRPGGMSGMGGPGMRP